MVRVGPTSPGISIKVPDTSSKINHWYIAAGKGGVPISMVWPSQGAFLFSKVRSSPRSTSRLKDPPSIKTAASNWESPWSAITSLIVYGFPTTTFPMAVKATVWPFKLIAASCASTEGRPGTSKLYCWKNSVFISSHCPGIPYLTFVTSIGVVVSGITARFWTTPVIWSVSINAKASEKEHSKPLLYSSEAKIKSKLIWSIWGTKLNWMDDALLVLVAVVFASKSASPGQPKSPLLITEVLGPGTKLTSPDIKTMPSSKGKSEPLASKKAIPLSLPKSVPVCWLILLTSAQGLLIRTSSTSCWGVKVSSTTIWPVTRKE